MRIGRTIAFILVGVYITQIIFYYPQLPEYMATNFGGSGNPQAWTSKNLFLIINTSILLIPFLIFLFLPTILRKTPDRLLNIPNKEYWLTEERREETFKRTENYFEWIFVGIIAFTIIIFQMVVNANLSEDKNLSGYFGIVLIGFFIYIIVLVVKLILTFRKPS